MDPLPSPVTGCNAVMNALQAENANNMVLPQKANTTVANNTGELGLGDAEVAYPPLNFFYTHYHNAIRSQLEALTIEIRSLNIEHPEQNLKDELTKLKQSYRFLEQIYQYHSHVEDEVVYPALDQKVRNVTLAYTVEHQDEGKLFEQLSQTLTTALSQVGSQRTETLRELMCKGEEINTTLRRHLAKEEEQLLPLLLQHFSHSEQAELVAQFLYCIPLATVEKVLAWLKPTVPMVEQAQLLNHIQAVVPDSLLLQLISTWLKPLDAENDAPEPVLPPKPSGPLLPTPFLATQPEPKSGSPLKSSPPAATLRPPHDTVEGGSSNSSVPMASAHTPAPTPLRGVIHIHRSIVSALEGFVQEIRSLKQQQEGEMGGDATAAQLSQLLDKLKFLRSVCMFHTASEEDVMYPELLRLMPDQGDSAQSVCKLCCDEHLQEVGLFEDMSQLLSSARALARRGRKELKQVLADLCQTSEQTSLAVSLHMKREEREVIPMLELHLSVKEQQCMLWRTLRAMPLRLLERVMPWVVVKLSEVEVSELLVNIRQGAPDSDVPLVELLTRWAGRGRQNGEGLDGRPSAAPPMFPNLTCEQHLALPAARQDSGSMGCPTCPAAGTSTGGARGTKRPRGTPGEAPLEQGALLHIGAAPHGLHGAHGTHGAQSGLGVVVAPLIDCCCSHVSPLPSPSSSHMNPHQHAHLGVPKQAPGQGGTKHNTHGVPSPHAKATAVALAKSGDPGNLLNRGGFNPIDHIFQFHRALRQELHQLERDSVQLERAIQVKMKELDPNHPNHPSKSTDPSLADAKPSQAIKGGSLPKSAVQQLDGRFQFLWGIYRAHSRCEDEIVFPALESKEVLRNVSHAYTLDHHQEEILFLDLSKVIEEMKSCIEASNWEGRAMHELALDVRHMCAAIRASVETHIHSEESELWPLFAEHFSCDEQQYLVGVIIGRTGAQVLQALMPWISESFPCDDKAALMDSLRQATKNTMFDQWLGAINSKDAATAAGKAAAGADKASGGQAGGAGKAPNAGGAAGSDGPSGSGGNSNLELHRTLSDVLQYIVPGNKSGSGREEQNKATLPGGHAACPACPAGIEGEIPGTVAESSSFRPGWEDIFRMNQQTLEAAIRKVSSDDSLEPQRKAYLIQNIMVSRYIVAQQKRIRDDAATLGAHGPASDNTATMGPPDATTRTGEGSPSSAATALQSPDGVQLQPASAVQAKVQQTFHETGSSVLGCQHYKRKCQLVAPCCNQAFTCRICHDDASDHKMDRYTVNEMQCMECGLRQPVQAECSGCATSMANYYCSICHLFDDEKGRDIYHCPFCNVCRRGKGLGIDFFHCMQCNACMSLSLFSSHTCREKAMEGNCPVCSEYLFDSSHPIKELPCGHFMHSACFADYTRYNYTCPICSKSIGDMTVYFQMLDSLLASERLPADYTGRTQMILCNDCGRSGFAPFHFVYHCCPHCRSYNTRVK